MEATAGHHGSEPDVADTDRQSVFGSGAGPLATRAYRRLARAIPEPR
jgi:hypothetical protein